LQRPRKKKSGPPGKKSVHQTGPGPFSENQTERRKGSSTRGEMGAKFCNASSRTRKKEPSVSAREPHEEEASYPSRGVKRKAKDLLKQLEPRKTLVLCTDHREERNSFISSKRGGTHLEAEEKSVR